MTLKQLWGDSLWLIALKNKKHLAREAFRLLSGTWPLLQGLAMVTGLAASGTTVPKAQLEQAHHHLACVRLTLLEPPGRSYGQRRSLCNAKSVTDNLDKGLHTTVLDHDKIVPRSRQDLIPT